MASLQKDRTRPPLRLAITPFLVLGFGGLVLVAVAGVLLLTLTAGVRNTMGLLQDKGRLIVDAVALRVSQHLDPVQHQADFIGDLLASGAVSPDDRTRLGELLRASLAGTPQVRIAYIDQAGWYVAAEHAPAGPLITGGDWRADRIIANGIDDARRQQQRRAYFGDPVFIETIDATIVNLRRPVVIDGGFRGMVASVVTIHELSEFVAGLGTEEGLHPFVLYDNDYVLAHPVLEFGFEGLSAERPLPRVTEVGDPVLFLIWREGWQERRLWVGARGHVDSLGDRQWVFLYRSLEGYADRPLLVGSYGEVATVGGELARLRSALGFGLGTLVAALALAVLFGRYLGRPIQQLALAAAALRGLELDTVPRLARSRLRELDEAVAAFNAMVGGLQIFARYVPRRLVLRLIGRGELRPLVSETREVSVLFTDIVGFTGMAEHLSGEETAELLNHHFALLTACVEAEEGTVDKFIGDALMAFWNAPDPQPDHALRALRASRAIAQAVRAGNERRPAPLRLRIGVHTGPALVGNIGGPSRMNYTLVGDTVNAAQRLQELGKRLAPEEEVAVLVGDTTARLVPDQPLVPLGRHSLRGRAQATLIFRLA